MSIEPIQVTSDSVYTESYGTKSSSMIVCVCRNIKTSENGWVERLFREDYECGTCIEYYEKHKEILQNTILNSIKNNNEREMREKTEKNRGE